MEPLAAAGALRARGDPSAHVHVVCEQFVGGLGPAPHRVEVAAPEIPADRVADGMGRGVALAELELAPDEADAGAVLVDRPGRPSPAPRPPGQLDACVDAADIVPEVRPTRRTGADVTVREHTASNARRPAGRLDVSCRAGSALELIGSAGSAA